MRFVMNSRRRILSVLLAVFFFLIQVPVTAFAEISAGPSSATSGELRAVWISSLDWEKLPDERNEFEDSVNMMMNRCVAMGMNAVFVQVRSNADAMYPSELFPWSRFITGSQGVDPGFDPLNLFLGAAHDHGLQFYAWISPTRVTGFHNRYSQVSKFHPAKIWLTDAEPENDRYVLKHGGEYYLNPSVPEIQDLIVNGIAEIVARYNVDGVCFDETFYPELLDSDESRWFDYPEYQASRSELTAAQWRRQNVNQIVKRSYEAVKKARPDAEFGVSPDGWLQQVRSRTRSFLDVDTWVTEKGYVDFLMPKLYWGFEPKLEDGSPAPYAFASNVSQWVDLNRRGRVKLYLGLALFMAGSGTKDNNQVPEWLRRNDILKRQVELGRKNGKVDGFGFYSYGSFQESACQQEITNLLKILREH